MSALCSYYELHRQIEGLVFSASVLRGLVADMSTKAYRDRLPSASRR